MIKPREFLGELEVLTHDPHVHASSGFVGLLKKREIIMIIHVVTAKCFNSYYELEVATIVWSCVYMYVFVMTLYVRFVVRVVWKFDYYRVPDNNV